MARRWACVVGSLTRATATDGYVMTSVQVLHSIRNGIIEYLELASSFDAQRGYQARVPVHVPDEIICKWEDLVPDPNEFGPPVFSKAECEAIRRYHAIWDEVADLTDDPLPSLEECFLLPAWLRLRDAAAEALRVFAAESPTDGAKHGFRVGGLVALGFAHADRYLLVVTHSGRGVFDLDTGERVARDNAVLYPERGSIPGIGPLQGEPVAVAEYDFEHDLVLVSESGRYRAVADSSFVAVEEAT